MPVTIGIIGLTEKKICGSDGKRLVRKDRGSTVRNVAHHNRSCLVRLTLRPRINENCHHFPPLVYENPSNSIVPEKGQMSPSYSLGEDSLPRSFVRPAATILLASTTFKLLCRYFQA